MALNARAARQCDDGHPWEGEVNRDIVNTDSDTRIGVTGGNILKPCRHFCNTHKMFVLPVLPLGR